MKKSLAAMIAILSIATGSFASGVKIYTCSSADGSVTVHMVPPKLKATVWEQQTEGLRQLSCAQGSGAMLFRCAGENRMFDMASDRTAVYTSAGKTTPLACHISHAS